MGAKVATRKAYGDALKALAARPEVVAMDGEVSNSTYAEDFKACPDRFFEMFIAEQQMVARRRRARGEGLLVYASTFAAFFTRAYDFIRVAESPRSTSASSAPTPASRSAPMARRRWRSRTWRRSGR